MRWKFHSVFMHYWEGIILVEKSSTKWGYVPVVDPSPQWMQSRVKNIFDNIAISHVATESSERPAHPVQHNQLWNPKQIVSRKRARKLLAPRMRMQDLASIKYKDFNDQGNTGLDLETRGHHQLWRMSQSALPYGPSNCILKRKSIPMHN